MWYYFQDDVVMGTLTVRENLMFSANMRLSNETYTQEEKKTLVEDTIVELGLERCADTKVWLKSRNCIELHQYLHNMRWDNRFCLSFRMITMSRIAWLFKSIIWRNYMSHNMIVNIVYKVSIFIYFVKYNGNTS